MKLQIDTVCKTIKLEQSAKIVDFIALVKKLLPNDWKEYSVEPVENIYNWCNPIYVPPIIPYWETQPVIICKPLDTTITSTFCIEAN